MGGPMALNKRRQVHDIYNKHTPTLYIKVSPWKPIYKCSCGNCYHPNRSYTGCTYMSPITREDVARGMRLIRSNVFGGRHHLKDQVGAWRRANMVGAGRG